MKALRLLLAAVLLAVNSAAWADLSGPVIAILDGDTVDILVNSRPVRIRLAQIDAPEKKQAFGTRSRQALSDMIFRQVVTVAESGPDRYGRTVGTVFVSGTNVNAAMVNQGMAWAYRQYVTDRSIIQLEEQARAARRGLWVDPAPVEPWLFRRNK
nr:micrococcal nuclease/endonuclease [uncultured bacterium]